MGMNDHNDGRSKSSGRAINASHTREDVRIAPMPVGLSMTVPCLDCKAEVGNKCVSMNNDKELSQVHVSRRRIAIRRWNERREAEGTLHIRRKPAGDRTDEVNGSYCPMCCKMIMTRFNRLVLHSRKGLKMTKYAVKCEGSNLHVNPPEEINSDDN